MENLNLVLEIVRDVESANKQNGTQWKQWKLSEIAEYYNFPDAFVKLIISKAINTNGRSLDVDIKDLERMADEKVRFDEFVKGLTELSKKTGVVIRAIGGVYINDIADVQDIEYTNDSTSGDLEPIFEDEE